MEYAYTLITKHNLLCVSYSNQVCELLIVKVHSPVLYIVIIYRPPDCLLQEFQDKNKNKNEFITITETMMEIIHY